METDTVTFTFPGNNITADITFQKIGALVIVNVDGYINSGATQIDGTIISATPIPTKFRPKEDACVLCSRTDAGAWDATNDRGIQSLSTTRLYANGNLGLGMLTPILTGVSVQGTGIYVAQ